MGCGESFEEEHTQLTPRVLVAYRRATLVWLVAAACVFLVAIVLAVVARVGVSATHEASASGIDAEASRVAAAIDSSARAAQLKADGIAATPMLRAAIVTDGATIADVIATEVRIAGKPGEVMEFFQVRDKTPTSILKVPADAPAKQPLMGRAMRLDNLGADGLNVVVGSPITPNDAGSAITGQLVLSVPVELAEARKRLAEIGSEGVLYGAGDPIILTSKPGATNRGPKISRAVRASDEWKLGELTISVTPHAQSGGASWLDPVSYVVAGIGALLLVVWFFARRR